MNARERCQDHDIDCLCRAHTETLTDPNAVTIRFTLQNHHREYVLLAMASVSWVIWLIVQPPALDSIRLTTNRLAVVT